MGLDVYLYHCTDLAVFVEHENASEKAHDRIWKKVTGGRPYEKLTETEKDEARRLTKEYDAAHPELVKEEKIEHDSRIYPEHMFKIGHLRSSYNDSGIEGILGRSIGKGLGYVFDAGDQYRLSPDWNVCLRRAIEVRDEYARHLAEHGDHRVFTVSAVRLFGGGAKRNDGEALEVFRREQKREAPCGSYGNADGEFFRAEPLDVYALIPGTDLFGRPAIHVVTKATDEASAWVKQATEIVVEMIEWVLAQPDPEHFHLHWSC